MQGKSPEKTPVSVLEGTEGWGQVHTETDEKETCLITFPSSLVKVAVTEEKRPTVKTSSAPNVKSRRKKW